MKIKKHWSVLIVVLSLFAAMKSHSQTSMTCVTQVFNVCEEGQCRQIINPNKSWVELELNKMKKCDGKSCDTYPVDVARSGEFINIAIGNRGYLLKIDGEGRFVEVSTLGLMTIVKNGKCV
jgi:hypothetical protein